MTLTIDVHALQSLPPSNINRDDTGAPKSAVFGGVPRQRVSSQSWKRAIRQDFERSLPAGSIGFRTKHAVDLVARKVLELTGDDTAWPAARAGEAAADFFRAAGIKVEKPRKKAAVDETAEAPAGVEIAGEETGYLLFISPRQITRAAESIIAAEGAKPAKKDAKEILDTEHSIDIAMFGRMVADDSAYNVDAAVQVAHAIGVHESEPEFDYFTAVDDVVEDREETGAGMIGTVQMMSSTLYRFATIDVESLRENLGDATAAAEAVGAFLSSFVTALPTGKQNTFANNTLPELVYVTIRDTRSVSLVNAFEEPVRVRDGQSRRALAAQRLAEESRTVASAYGFEPSAAFVVALGDLGAPFADIAEAVTLTGMISRITDTLRAGA